MNGVLKQLGYGLSALEIYCYRKIPLFQAFLLSKINYKCFRGSSGVTRAGTWRKLAATNKIIVFGK